MNFNNLNFKTILYLINGFVKRFLLIKYLSRQEMRDEKGEESAFINMNNKNVFFCVHSWDGKKIV